MVTKIFYFSTTGNSLALARALGSGLGDTELISIPKAIDEPVDMNASRLGFVFPVYAWGLPRIVVDFLKGLKLPGKPYVFAAVTCGGTPGLTLMQLRRLLRKAKADLHAGFACREGANTVTDDPGFVRFLKRMNRIQYSSGKDRLPEMLSVIRDKKTHAPETSSFGANLFGGMLHGLMSLAKDQLKSFDRSYYVDERCLTCRTCEKVCPRGNVRIEGNKPVWHHNCEMCYGCIQWCPQQAIHIANETCRYHNPSIAVEEMMLR
ncbi:MAG: EFR1 family ferrodoxin [Christensenellales bacterium]